MSTIYGRTYEINVTDLNFPFLSTNPARQSIVQDIPENVSGGRNARNVTPQILSLRNALPTKDGYSSLRRTTQIPAAALPAAPSSFLHAFTFHIQSGVSYTAAKLDAHLAVSVNGEAVWTYFPITGLDGDYDLTQAFVDGQQYFHFSYLGTKKFTPAPIGLEDYELVGLDNGQIKGILAASSYLLAFTSDTIYWDSPLARGDFTPELGGAGSAKISDLRGEIIACLPLANGFVIYSSKNAVGAQYTGNANFPWLFREIRGSAGIENQYNVAYNNNLSAHIAWTHSGLQEVSFQGAQLTFPELTEFLNKRTIETFDFTNGFVRTKSATVFRVKIEYIGHRFLGCSYAPDADASFTEALIYDTELKRWGKLNNAHVALTSFLAGQKKQFITYQQEYEDTNRTYEDLDTAGLKYTELFELLGENLVITDQIASVEADGRLAYYTKNELCDEVAEVPTAPSNLQVVDSDYNFVDLQWEDNADDETSYLIERWNTAYCGAFDLIATLPAGTTTYNDTDVLPEITYQYRIRAVSSNGYSEYSNTAEVTTPANEPPEEVFTIKSWTGRGLPQTIDAGIDLTGSAGSPYNSGGFIMVGKYGDTDAVVDNGVIVQNRDGNYKEYRGGNSPIANPNQNIQFTSSGFQCIAANSSHFRGSTQDYLYLALMFKKKAGFLDIVHYIGNGSGSARAIPHGLGVAPTLIHVIASADAQSTDSPRTWDKYRADSNPWTGGGSTTTFWGNHGFSSGTAAMSQDPDSVNFYIGGSGAQANTNGREYTAFLFAEGANLKQGFHVGNGSANGPVLNIGFTPDAIFVKAVGAGPGSFPPCVEVIRARPDFSTAASWRPLSNSAEFRDIRFFEVDPSGLKIISSSNIVNQNGVRYVWAAFKSVRGIQDAVEN